MDTHALNLAQNFYKSLGKTSAAREMVKESFCVFLPPEPFSFDLHSRLTLAVLLPLSHSITTTTAAVVEQLEEQQHWVAGA